jgi:hypothetical protein
MIINKLGKQELNHSRNCGDPESKGRIEYLGFLSEQKYDSAGSEITTGASCIAIRTRGAAVI